MVPIGGKPLLQHHIELLHNQGIREFLINLHYLPDRITDHFGDGSRWGVHITYFHEHELLGTAGAIKQAEPLLKDASFLVLYGDNLLQFRLDVLRNFHRDRNALATIALFESDEPWTGGVVETDACDRVISFKEKPDPKQISTNLISGGILLFEPQVLEHIPKDCYFDFGNDVFPKLVRENKRVYAIQLNAYIQDIGTPERLAKAQRDYTTGFVEKFK